MNAEAYLGEGLAPGPPLKVKKILKRDKVRVREFAGLTQNILAVGLHLFPLFTLPYTPLFERILIHFCRDRGPGSKNRRIHLVAIRFMMWIQEFVNFIYC